MKGVNWVVMKAVMRDERMVDQKGPKRVGTTADSMGDRWVGSKVVQMVEMLEWSSVDRKDAKLVVRKVDHLDES